MKKFFIKTFGCKTNQLEHEVIINDMNSKGFFYVENPSDADFYILNSCAVTENAKNEALYFLKTIKNKNPNIKTILTGCVAQLESNDLIKNNFVDFVYGNNEKLNLADFLIQKINFAVDDIFNVKEFNNKFIEVPHRTRANLKIQDGCNNRCSYCTIPLARGYSRSNSIKKIVEQINIFIKNGIKEVVLTGIHIGQWGEDFQPALNLIDLLKEIEKTHIERYRLGSLNPLEFDDELINFMMQSSKFCPHFHISLQSLNDEILNKMNRKYSAQKALQLIEKLNNSFENPFLGCDIIVGFPSETDEHFKQTLENIKKSPLSQIHVFPYSIRKNTLAATMPNQIEDTKKKERVLILKQLSQEKHITFLNKNINSIHQAQVLQIKDAHYIKCITKNYINVFVNKISDVKQGDLIDVKILKILDDKVFAEIIK